MDIPLDEVIYVEGIASAATGAASDADSTPTFAVYEEATDTDIGVGGNMTKRTSLTGDYRASFTASAANGFEIGKWYVVIGSATISGIACKGVLARFRIVAVPGTAGGLLIAGANEATSFDSVTVAGAIIVSGGLTLANTGTGKALTIATTGSGVPIHVENTPGTATSLIYMTTGGGTASGIRYVIDSGIDVESLGSTNLGSLAVTGAITATNASNDIRGVAVASIATDAIDADAIAADAVTEIQSGLATAANLATVASYIDTEVADIRTRVLLGVPAYAPGTSGGVLINGTNAALGIVGDVTIGGDLDIGGTLIANITGNLTGNINGDIGGSVTGSVDTVTVKTGFKLASDGLDSISTTAPTGVASDFREMMVQTWRRFFKRTTKSSTQIKTYADNGTTVLTTQTYTSVDPDDDVGAAS